jgi:hypothetical protein
LTDNPWNSINMDPEISIPVYDTDGDPSSYGGGELYYIVAIWRAVAEDYLPFDVDVTTEDPGVLGIIKSDEDDADYGIRVCIGGTDWVAGGGAAGIAFLDSFGGDSDVPALVFSDLLGLKDTWETISHEVGEVARGGKCRNACCEMQPSPCLVLGAWIGQMHPRFQMPDAVR